jgi:hypothetical protein
MIELVYVFHATGTNRYKIGYTTDVEQRMMTLQVGCPYPLELVELRVVPDGYTVEQEIHTELADYRKQGEWFEVSNYATIRIAIVRRCQADMLFGKVLYTANEVDISPKVAKLIDLAQSSGSKILYIVAALWVLFLPTKKIVKERSLTDSEIIIRATVEKKVTPIGVSLNPADYDFRGGEGW